MRCQELPSLSLQTNPFGVWRKPLYPLSLIMDPFSTIWLSLHHMLLKLATSSFWGTLIKLWVSIWKKNCNTKSPNFHRVVVGDWHLFYWQPIFCHIVANSLVWIYDLSCQIFHTTVHTRIQKLSFLQHWNFGCYCNRKIQTSTRRYMWRHSQVQSQVW